MEKDESVKILFKFYSEVLEQEAEETIWALKVDEGRGLYRLDSIPFYTASIATDDVVHAEYDDTEEMLTFREVVESSGNSTVWVVVLNEAMSIEEIQDIFYELDCISDALDNHYFAMEVKASANYLHIKDKLNQFRSQGFIDYAEPCLSAKHRY